jgi:hypothetical protein
MAVMSQDISSIERHLTSKDKQVRLKALKLILRHPDATPIQLVRCLCSDDNRNFEFLEMFELGSAMRESWSRLRGVTDDEVYEYLSSLYAADPTRNINHVVHVLELLCSRRALDMLEELRASAPSASRLLVERVASYISHQLVSNDS